MSRELRSRDQIERDRERIGQLRLEGWTFREIGDEMKLSATQVRREAEKVIDGYKKSSVEAYGRWVDVELAKLERMEAQAWREWYASKAPRTETTTGVEGNSVKVIERNGDPRYLETVLRCVERRAKLLGLDATQTIKVEAVIAEERRSVVGVMIAWAMDEITPHVPPGQIEAAMERLAQRLEGKQVEVLAPCARDGTMKTEH